MHRNGIAHGDISLQNMVMDLILDDEKRFAGVRGSERKYALIDFETARFGDHTQASQEETSRIRSLFKRDVLTLARSLEVNLRVRV